MAALKSRRKSPNRKDVTIRVRDRRQKYQYSVANVVMDEWLPIIGHVGYALYGLYVRLSNLQDERAYPGYSTIMRHMGIGRSTISEHNRLLVICGLIEIVPGDFTTSNDYYLLDIPHITPETRVDIRKRIETGFSVKSINRQTFLKRLDKWQPLFAKKDGAFPTLVFPDQESSPVHEQGSPVDEHPNPGGEQSSPVHEQSVRAQDLNNPNRTIQINNPKRNNPKSTSSGKRDGDKQESDDADFQLPDSLDEMMEAAGVHTRSRNRLGRLIEEHGYTLPELGVMFEVSRKKAKENPTGYWMRWIESGAHMPGSQDGMEAMWAYYKLETELPY
jgi:hypothetical protein